ncbi:hypothetical protein KUA24_56 [Vibrio phage HNL01]|nr:hypothetical protein KUA24_56 [Vibrio phage HNL01]
MFSISIELLEDYTKELERRVRELEEAEIFVGYTEAQGTHYSDMSYVDLITILSNGSSEMNLPARDIFGIAYAQYKPFNKTLKKDLNQYLSNIKGRPKISVQKIGSNFAKGFFQEMNMVFGNESLLQKNSEFTKRLKMIAGVDPDKPLMWTGDLKSNLGYHYDGKLQYTNK